MKLRTASFMVNSATVTVLIDARQICDDSDDDDDDDDNDYTTPVSKVDVVGDCFSPRRPRRAAART